jgi:hypothetical protein
VGDIKELALETDRSHKLRRNCACTMCKTIRRESACQNPHKCQLTATKILKCLQPKWDPLNIPVQDNLDLTPRRRAKNKQSEKTGDPILFDPSVTLENIAEGFRIFTNHTNEEPLPAL